MKLIFSGGGTGGHIYPAITLIESIKERNPQAQILYVGTSRGLEADIVPKENIPFKTIDIEGFSRHLTVKNIVVFGKAVAGMIKARTILKEYKPDAVIGTGGYVSGPILLAASFMNIPTLIQDQNAIPGITNKILSKFVNKIACGYESACSHFPSQKTVLTGNPVRKDVLMSSRSEALSSIGLDNTRKTVLITGGSRGARRINEAMTDVYEQFLNDTAVQFLHITGTNEYQKVLDSIKAKGIDLGRADNIFVKPYLYDMPKALAAADMAVARAGAIGLAEITACGIPSILIPYPYAAENHQEFNARALVEKGAAVMILNSELTGKRLARELTELLASENKVQKMALASKTMGHPGAAGEIADMILELIYNKG
ncbi:undecaprenyldiphospho-muramoylpentapeptide beta-N-acetylglucosaminyltransferase [Pectinatus haikarae]|uniref:UDP-N-acetylglucosamine--N-acetylmuramyl-(pentapeptide) pyrophosphoryl-undecaprenol N-acetylglucosamine transferase n=1 Tax=Pectinatus haikarae TaxID=349096 RepID=A0ABT9Y6M8_9FIRM|nr:undecaprenyldiphospho-muramoylpentapeptide beta-N-acetylglucosaminyltransferase [Pectinatus haikarae]MDQ0203480.1 UDP-N-acetylglucosamine--N-acetylmuramyl-(pentapeptide) pyrophosphoryl-undecaprenol N-acetylglucosamine transferase [Pectinatus haikarae]